MNIIFKFKDCITIIIMISEVEFLSIADYVFPNDYMFSFSTNTPLLHPSIVNNLPNNTIIYLHFDYIWQFVDLILPHISSYFKIITGFSDLLVPYLREPRRDYTADKILNNKYLIKWYAINCIIDHPKIMRIPIGIPRTHPGLVSHNDKKLIRYSVNPESYILVTNGIKNIMQNKNIMDVMKSKKDTNKLLYINYSSESTDDTNYRDNFGFRRKLDDYLLETPFKKESTFKFWEDNLLETHKHKFTLEAFGRCFDGFRVWEAILVGTIPVVFSSPLNELYENLPVLVINSFEQINEAFLNEQFEILVNKNNYNFEKLYIKYWENIIKQ